MLASNILTYSDFLKDSKEPLEIRKAMVRRYRELKSITAVALEIKLLDPRVRGIFIAPSLIGLHEV